MCVHTLTPRENRVQNILDNSEKNTIFNEHPVSFYVEFQNLEFNQKFIVDLEKYGMSTCLGSYVGVGIYDE